MYRTSKLRAQIYGFLLTHALVLSLGAAESLDVPRSDAEIANIILDRGHAVDLPERPLRCEVGFDLINLVRIDEAKETYTIDFYMWVRWKDSRLQFQPAEFRTDRTEVHISPPSAWDNDRLWNPKIEFMNLVETKTVGQDLRLEAEGFCRYTVRQTAVFKFASEANALKRFPFDNQELPIAIESFRWNNDDVQFQIAGGEEFQKRQLAKLKSAEWKILRVQTQSLQKSYEGDSKPFSEASIVLTIKREAGFYLWRICLPLVILVGIAMSVVWIPNTHPEARMILSVTTLVAVTTFSIVVNADLPRLPYLTLMDVWMLVSFILSACGAIENVVAASIAHHGRPRPADTIDYHCRWIAPTLYVIATLLCLAAYL